MTTEIKKLPKERLYSLDTLRGFDMFWIVGGLMVVDIASKKASGAALGIVGIMSYTAAGIQDIVSGYLIEGNKTIINGETIYDFGSITIFWISAAALSVVFALFTWKKT
ncbi:MAG: hypothetical protein KAH07_09090 [Flavobacteriaceae bacterium]|nr:hypothetical protein [Flavobacteriaceae bacterium]